MLMKGRRKTSDAGHHAPANGRDGVRKRPRRYSQPNGRRDHNGEGIGIPPGFDRASDRLSASTRRAWTATRSGTASSHRPPRPQRTTRLTKIGLATSRHANSSPSRVPKIPSQGSSAGPTDGRSASYRARSTESIIGRIPPGLADPGSTRGVIVSGARPTCPATCRLGRRLRAARLHRSRWTRPSRRLFRSR